MSACPICGRQVPERYSLQTVRGELEWLVGFLEKQPKKYEDALAAARRAKALLVHAMGDAPT